MSLRTETNARAFRIRKRGSRFQRCREFLDPLNNCQFMHKNSPLWASLVSYRQYFRPHSAKEIIVFSPSRNTAMKITCACVRACVCSCQFKRNVVSSCQARHALLHMFEWWGQGVIMRRLEWAFTLSHESAIT